MTKTTVTTYNVRTKQTKTETAVFFASMAELLAWNEEQDAKRK